MNCSRIRTSLLRTAAVAIAIIASIPTARGTLAADSAATLRIVALSDSAPADGDGLMRSFMPSVINDHGEVLFVAEISGSTRGANDRVLIRSAGASLTELARAGDPLPSGPGRLGPMWDPALTNSGIATFVASLNGVPDAGTLPRGIFQHRAGSLAEVVRTGDRLPDGSDVFTSLSFLDDNEAGDLLFNARLRSLSSNIGVFRVQNGAIEELVREGKMSPLGFPYTAAYGARLTDDSLAVTYASVNLGIPNFGMHTLFTHRGGTSDVFLPDEFPSPDGNGTIRAVSGFSVNQAGNIAFVTARAGTDRGLEDAGAFFLLRPEGLSIVARRGQAVPDRSGTFDFYGVPVETPFPTLTDRDEVIMNAAYSGNDGFRGRGVFRSHDGVLTTIAVPGDRTPSGDAFFGEIGTYIANEQGDVAFEATLVPGPNQAYFSRGVFHYSPRFGLQEVARRGDLWPEGPLAWINFDDINRRGDLAISFGLVSTNGPRGIAVWSPVPEPAAMHLAVAALVGAFPGAYRRRRP